MGGWVSGWVSGWVGGTNVINQAHTRLLRSAPLKLGIRSRAANSKVSRTVAVFSSMSLYFYWFCDMHSNHARAGIRADILNYLRNVAESVIIAEIVETV